jgi:hypothetical protein
MNVDVPRISPLQVRVNATSCLGFCICYSLSSPVAVPLNSPLPGKLFCAALRLDSTLDHAQNLAETASTIRSSEGPTEGAEI